MASSSYQPSERAIAKTLSFHEFLFPIPELHAGGVERKDGRGARLHHDATLFVSEERVPKIQHVRTGLQRSLSAVLPSFRFAYKPLDATRREIRLLTIRAGCGSRPVSCTVFHTSLSTSQIPYETISYHRDRGRGRAVIQLNDTLFLVPKNASLALRRMRDPTRDRVVWLDAVCINQDDTVERSGQTTMMRDIHQRAVTNLIWLGEDDTDPAPLAKSIGSVLQNIERATEPFNSFVEAVSTPDGQFSQDCRFLDPQIDLEPLVGLFSSPWWSRLWAAQGAAVSGANLCHLGPATFDLLDALRVAAWLMFNQSRVRGPLRDMAGVAHAWNLWHLVDREYLTPAYVDCLTRYLPALHQLLQHHACEHPKDHVYALLALHAPRDDSPDPSPDLPSLLPVTYSEARMSTPTLLRDATRHFLSETRSLSLLPQIPLAPSPAFPSLTSWTIPFPSLSGPASALPVPFPTSLFAASRPSDLYLPAICMSSAPARRDPSILVLRGVAMGRVSGTSASLSAVTSEHPGTVLDTLVRAWGLLPGLPGGAEGYVVEFAVAMLGGVDAEGCRAWEGEFRGYNALIRMLKRGRLPDGSGAGERKEIGGGAGNEDDEGDAEDGEDGEDVEARRAARRYYEALQVAGFARRFFVTPEGRLGLGPEGVRQGDVVAVLFGSRVPFVLRGETGGRHRIVGACYVHGSMDGETIREFRSSGRRAQSFRIV